LIKRNKGATYLKQQMKAKRLFQKDVVEAKRPRPGSDVPDDFDMPERIPHSVRLPSDFPPWEEMGDAGIPDEIRSMVRERGKPQQFTSRELGQLKNMVILMLAKFVSSAEDEQIARAFIEGKDLDDYQLNHILDETRRLELPEDYQELLAKLASMVKR
jgi:hypothetical protein